MNDIPYEGSSDESQLEHLRNLARRKETLKARKFKLEIERIKLEQQIGQISKAEAAISQQKIIATAADDLIKRKTFRERFCLLYHEHERLTTTVDLVVDLADRVCDVIAELYPNLVGYAALATLSAIGILKKGIDLYCSAMNSDDQARAGATI